MPTPDMITELKAGMGSSPNLILYLFPQRGSRGNYVPPQRQWRSRSMPLLKVTQPIDQRPIAWQTNSVFFRSEYGIFAKIISQMSIFESNLVPARYHL